LSNLKVCKSGKKNKFLSREITPFKNRIYKNKLLSRVITPKNKRIIRIKPFSAKPKSFLVKPKPNNVSLRK